MNQGFQSEFLSYVRSRSSSAPNEPVGHGGQQSADSTEANGSSEEGVEEAASDANDDHWPDAVKPSSKITSTTFSADIKDMDMDVEALTSADKTSLGLNRKSVSSTPPSSDTEKRQRRSRTATPSSNINSRTNGHSKTVSSGASVNVAGNGVGPKPKCTEDEEEEENDKEDAADDSDGDDADDSPPEPQLAHRPKRNIQPKSAELVAGLSWREENDLKKAIYASLQESRSRGKVTPTDDHKAAPIGLRRHDSHRTPTPSSGEDRKSGRRRPVSIDESSQDSTRSCVSSENSTDKDEFSICARVHAQRKFAAGSRPGSPNASPSKPKPTPKKQFFTTKKAKTEDFLTFLCLRGSHVLPPHLDFYHMEDSDENGYSYPTTPRQSQQSSRPGTPGNAHSPRSRSRAVSPAPSKASSSDREPSVDINDLGVNPLAGLGVDSKPSVVAGTSTSSYSSTAASTSSNCRRSHRPSKSPFSSSARMHGQAPPSTFRPPPFIGGHHQSRQGQRDTRTRGYQWEASNAHFPRSTSYCHSQCTSTCVSIVSSAVTNVSLSSGGQSLRVSSCPSECLSRCDDSDMVEVAHVSSKCEDVCPLSSLTSDSQELTPSYSLLRTDSSPGDAKATKDERVKNAGTEQFTSLSLKPGVTKHPGAKFDKNRETSKNGSHNHQLTERQNGVSGVPPGLSIQEIFVDGPALQKPFIARLGTIQEEVEPDLHTCSGICKQHGGLKCIISSNPVDSDEETGEDCMICMGSSVSSSDTIPGNKPGIENCNRISEQLQGQESVGSPNTPDAYRLLKSPQSVIQDKFSCSDVLRDVRRCDELESTEIGPLLSEETEVDPLLSEEMPRVDGPCDDVGIDLRSDWFRQLVPPSCAQQMDMQVEEPSLSPQQIIDAPTQSSNVTGLVTVYASEQPLSDHTDVSANEESQAYHVTVSTNDQPQSDLISTNEEPLSSHVTASANQGPQPVSHQPADETPQSSPKKSSSRRVSVNNTTSPNKRKSVDNQHMTENLKKSRFSDGREKTRNVSRSPSAGRTRLSLKSAARPVVRSQVKHQLSKVNDSRKATRRKLVMRARTTVAKQRERQLQRTTRSSSNLGQNLEPGLVFNTREKVVSSKKDSVKKIVHAEIHVPPSDTSQKRQPTVVKRRPTRPNRLFNVRTRLSNKARADKRRLVMRLRAEAKLNSETEGAKNMDIDTVDVRSKQEKVVDVKIKGEKVTEVKDSVHVKVDELKVKKDSVASAPVKPEKMKRPDRSPETRSQRAKAEAAALAAARHRSLLEEAAKKIKTDEQTTPTRTRRTLDLESSPSQSAKPLAPGYSPVKVETPVQSSKPQAQIQTSKNPVSAQTPKIQNAIPPPIQQTPSQKASDEPATPSRTRRSSMEEVSPRTRRSSVDDVSPRTRRSSLEEASPRTRQAPTEENVGSTTPRGRRLSVESRDSSRESTRTRRSLRDDSADKLADGHVSPVPDVSEKSSPSVQMTARTRITNKAPNMQPSTSPQKHKTVARNQTLIPSFYSKPKKAIPNPAQFRKSPSPTKRVHAVKIEPGVASRTVRPAVPMNTSNIPDQKPPMMPRVAIRRPFPQPTDEGHLVEIPTYHPSPEQFQDPISYIASIRLDAEPYGMCRIIPPDGWKPECRIHDDLKFMTQVQYIHRLHHRWGPNALQLECIKKHLESQGLRVDQPPIVGGVELDLALLLETVHKMGGMDQVIRKNKWAKLAETLHIPKVAQERHMRLYDVYCKFLLSYAMLSKEEKQKLAEQVLADRGRKKGKPQEQVVSKGRTRQLGEFFRMARNVNNMWFKEEFTATMNQVEAEYWRIVDEGKYHVTVQAAHIDCSQCGSGFPTRKDPAAHASPYPKHGWNFNNLQHNPGSVVRHLGTLSGISVPTLHISMVFGSSCWNRDQHLLPYIHYSHTGADISWYCIPSSEERKFQAAAAELAPDLVQDAPVWLTEDTLMINPILLVSKGVNVGHVVQQQGEFLIVFPRTFTATISAGYNISESLHFATSHWLSVGVEAATMLNLSCIPEIFSMDRLLFKLAQSEKASSDVLRRVLPLLEVVIREDLELRRQLSELGLKPTERMPAEELSPVKKRSAVKDEQNKCDISGKICFLSMVVNESEDRVFSPKNAIPLVQKKKNLRLYKLFYRYDEDEMWGIVQRVKLRLAAGSTPPKKKSKHRRHYTTS